MTQPGWRRGLHLTALCSVAFCLLAPTARGDEIHKLLQKGELKKAQRLLAKAPRLIHALDESEQTPLHVAAQLGHVEMVKALLAGGANVNARAYNQFTPLHLASDPTIVKLLIEHKADLDAKNAHGRTALEEAASCCPGFDHLADLPARKLTQILLAVGASYDIRSAIHLGDVNHMRALLKKNPAQARDAQEGLLHLAALDGRTAAVKVLLEYGADPNGSQTFAGGSVLERKPLPLAIRHPGVVKLLLDAGADANIRDNQFGMNATMLHLAADTGQVETATLLLAWGVRVDARAHKDFTPLHYAASAGNEPMVKFLLDNKANPRAQTATSATAMTLAAGSIRPKGKEPDDDNRRYKAVIGTLHASGVPIDLFTAVSLGNTPRVKELLKGKAALANTKSSDGIPLLHRAVGLNEREVVLALLAAGADVNGRDRDRYTALHSAAFWGREEMARLLLERGAKVNASVAGWTPLHESARLRTTPVAKLLLAAGADVNARDEHDRTPLSWAEEYGAPPQALVDLLRKYGGRR